MRGPIDVVAPYFPLARTSDVGSRSASPRSTPHKDPTHQEWERRRRSPVWSTVSLPPERSQMDHEVRELSTSACPISFPIQHPDVESDGHDEYPPHVEASSPTASSRSTLGSFSMGPWRVTPYRDRAPPSQSECSEPASPGQAGAKYVDTNTPARGSPLPDRPSEHDVRVFLTRSKGRLGYGAETLRDDDQVWVFAGARIPFIIRPKPHGRGCFELVGEAYVHGIMYGEAVQGREGKFVNVVLE
ncbi:hypothetical protein LTR53_011665 [Teratosphaeriaceae sp. CCFEE 6253]|nr:hypothetical protein LTR53_011665 [Teratosphaeriaceae sp. CCFEE 6253]